MPLKFLFVLFLICTCFFLAGCSVKYVQIEPDRHPLDNSFLPKASIMAHQVSIIAQRTNSTKQEIVCIQGTDFFQAKLNDLTDVAYASLEDVLKRINIKLSTNANKILKIEIIRSTCSVEVWTINFTAILRVTFGDGVTKDFIGSQRTGKVDINSNISDAINYAIAEMLNDSEIISYLNK